MGEGEEDESGIERSAQARKRARAVDTVYLRRLSQGQRREADTPGHAAHARDL